MRKYKSTNDVSNFCLHDAKVNKAYIKEVEKLSFELGNDRSVYILVSNKGNPHVKTMALKDAVIRYNVVYFDSSRIFLFKELKLFRRPILTIRKKVSWDYFCDNINKEKWQFEIVDETYG